METKKDNYKTIEEIDSELEQYFQKQVESPNEVPLAEGSSPMTTTTYYKSFGNKPIKTLWRPNNYRRKLRVLRKTNSASEKIQKAFSTIELTNKLQINNHTKVITIKNYKENITLQYGKDFLIGIWSQPIIKGHKQSFIIESFNIKDVNDIIEKEKKVIELQIDNALYSFTKDFDLTLPKEKPIWSRYEDFLRGEDYIEKLPENLIIHADIFKKVYGKGIEFIHSEKTPNPTVSTENYIKNRALESFAPEIAEAIQGGLLPVLNQLTEQIKLHLDVQRKTQKNLSKMGKSFDKFNKLLSSKQTKLGDWK